MVSGHKNDAAGAASLPGIHRSVKIGNRGPLAFFGPGLLIAVGYMDPGNWATSLAGGSAFGYSLLSVVLLSSLAAIFLQAQAARLGIATGRDLAQACRARYGRTTSLWLWLLAELSIIATDLAEVIGTAIGFQLLLGVSLAVGIGLAALDVVLLLGLQRLGFRKLEAFVGALLLIIAGCFCYTLALAAPDWHAVLGGLVPHAEIFTNTGELYLAIGILGATIMPHNLYLHSAIVQSRRFDETPEGRRRALCFATLDSTGALLFALLVNGAILILAAAAFHETGHTDVAALPEAYRLLSPLLGSTLAATAFAVALLACGVNSTVTATLAGQVVMEGFLNLRLPNWQRRLLTRGLAIIPALIVAWWAGEAGATRLLVFSQVILSLQLPFAMVPLLRLVADRTGMGPLALRAPGQALGWAIAVAILLANAALLAAFL